MLPASGQRPLLTVDGLTVSFEPRTRVGKAERFTALSGVSFALNRGETLGIVGESGCGKSTLLRALIRLTPADRGAVDFDGVDVMAADGAALKGVLARAQMVFQNPYDSLDPRMRVGDTVKEPLDIHRRDLPKEKRRATAEKRLAEVGLDASMAGRFPHELSGGQRQRVGIARALTTDPDLLLLDEPVSSLDTSVQAQVLSLLERIRAARGLTMLFVSHDMRVVKYLCGRAIVLYRGRVVEAAPIGPLTKTPRHPYTRLLLSSVPTLDPSARTANAEEVETATADPGAGCPFSPRCSEANERCRDQAPPLVEVEPDHFVACPVREGAKSA